ncbi:MAG: TerB N-terminal domain-containing protein [Spirochaetaceae bacterium]|jgi:hypothetical protein|nr:TerB N-terminal domain-containing protein [Spirochaetaceae bacterium]
MNETGPIPEDKLSLVLRCTAEVTGGVGRAWGRPALKYGKKRWDARKLSEGLTGPPGGGRPAGLYLPPDGRWVSRETLERLGLGPLGRFIDGGPIRPLPLKAAEVLCRGGKNIQGLWTGCELALTPHPRGGTPEKTFADHLDFLRYYGIPGGLIAGPARRTEALLADYLTGLAGEGEPGRVLVLTEKSYHDSFLARELASRRERGLRQDGGDFLSSGSFRVSIGFYETLTASFNSPWRDPDILILVNPEDLFARPGAEGFNRLKHIRARLRLGILANNGDLVFDPRPNDLKTFFGLQGELRKFAGFIFQNLMRPRPLPARYEFFPLTIRRPPEPFGADDPAPLVVGSLIMLTQRDTLILGGGRFTVQHKFKNIGAAEFKEEQEFFSVNPGEPVPPAPYPETGGKGIAFTRMNQEQRRFFLYWRGAFRKGLTPRTFTPYIYLYARELLLTMGNTDPMDCFWELLRLWRTYRRDDPDLDYHIPNWLTDFAVLYGIAGKVLPALLPYAEDGVDFLLKDLYLHKRYIEEDHPILFGDFVKSLGDKTLALFQDGEYGKELYRYTETALRAADRFLRETLGKSFFVFFYPSLSPPVLVEGFCPFKDMGFSSYTAEWIHFWRHQPLLDFTETLIGYIDLRLREDPGRRANRPRKKRAGPPSLDPPWKNLVDAEFGFPGGEAPEAPFSRGPIRLRPDRVDRIREESDDVRELLRTEEPGDPPPEPPPRRPDSGLKPRGEAPGRPDGLNDLSLAGFLAELGEAERAMLGRAAAAGAAPGLGDMGAVARQYGTMPELLIDGINEQFRERFGDLLIDIREGQPVILEEYREAVAGILKKT